MSAVAGRGVGARLARKEDRRFLRGRGEYVGNIRLPGMQEVAFVRSPMAHGVLKQIARIRAVIRSIRSELMMEPQVKADSLAGLMPRLSR